MNQISSTTRTGALWGPVLMLLASVTLAGSNIPQSLLPTPAQYGGYGMASTGMAFWQYLLATLFIVPLIARIGIGKLRTRHPVLHEIRAFVSALGVHVFVYGFASGMPIWQLVALLATGPLFIALGSIVFLRERLTMTRIVASLIAFTGAILASQLGSESFSPTILIPIAAAALWATTDVLTKYLSREETPDTLTVSLLVLITPNHMLILLLATVWSATLPGLTPAGLATGFPFALPSGNGLWLLLVLGALTAASQYLLAAAYKRADATYLQPFGDLKVPLSALLGWGILGQAPAPLFWLGAAMILGASILIFWTETQNRQRTLAAA
jgi:drug/metabolite transporter (DMT)-like permease